MVIFTIFLTLISIQRKSNIYLLSSDLKKNMPISPEINLSRTDGPVIVERAPFITNLRSVAEFAIKKHPFYEKTQGMLVNKKPGNLKSSELVEGDWMDQLYIQAKQQIESIGKWGVKQNNRFLINSILIGKGQKEHIERPYPYHNENINEFLQLCALIVKKDEDIATSLTDNNPLYSIARMKKNVYSEIERLASVIQFDESPKSVYQSKNTFDRISFKDKKAQHKKQQRLSTEEIDKTEALSKHWLRVVEWLTKIELSEISNQLGHNQS